MKLPATHPWFPGVFLEYFRASVSTKINHMRSKHRHKIRFQDVVYSKSNKWRAKILKKISKKTSTCCVKLIRKQEIISFLHRDKMSNKSRENWIWKKELTFDFRGQNETKYNRISFLVLFGLTFEKTTENKSKKTHQKINLKTRNRIIFSPHEEIRSIYFWSKRDGSCR